MTESCKSRSCAAKIRACRKDAEIVSRMLELGDLRLMACDGPCGGRLPDLSPEEWGKVYRACKRLTKRLA
jgi:hypothetical protein